MRVEMSLLENLALQLGCTYLSDLRFLQSWERMRLVQRLENIPAEAAGLSDWNDALEYLTGDKHPRSDAAQAKTALVEALSAPRANVKRGGGLASNAL